MLSLAVPRWKRVTHERRAATQEPTKREGDDSDPGLPTRSESSLTAKVTKGTLVTAWAASTPFEGKGPENPGVVAPLADAVVAATASMLLVGDCFA